MPKFQVPYKCYNKKTRDYYQEDSFVITIESDCKYDAAHEAMDYIPMLSTVNTKDVTTIQDFTT